MSKLLPSTKCTSPPHNPQPFHEEEGTEIPSNRFVPAYRKLVPGKGLKGGGNLTRDRKFDIDFGNEENTAVEGNDPRLSDARDWVAPRATEEELLLGTEEEPRKLSPKDLRDTINAWWEDSESIQTIENLQETVDSLGSSESSSGNLFSIVKTVELFASDEYVLTSADIGRTLIFNSVSDTLNIKMNACFGSLSDEIYVIAPRAFFHDHLDPINFFTEVNFVESGGDIVKIPPVVATGLVPSFRDGRAIACLKKCFTGGVGMDDWLLFGDLAAEVVENEEEGEPIE